MTDHKTSAKDWFTRGFAGGLMWFAAVTAMSWFWLSDGWSDLCGATRNADSEAIGFPLQIWREGQFYGSGWIIDLPKLGANVLIGLIFSIFCGFVGMRTAPQLTKIVRQHEDRHPHSRSKKITFSVRGLLMMTTLIAVILGTAKMFGPSPWFLGGIYFLGPLILILIAIAPAGLHWEQRVFVLLFCAITMLIGAVVLGSRLEMEFDRVLFGFFICWVPQSVIGTSCLLVRSFLIGLNHDLLAKK